MKCIKCKNEEGTINIATKTLKNGDIVKYFYCKKCNLERQKQYYSNKKGMENIMKTKRKYDYNNPLKIKARYEVKKNVKNGLLFKPKICSICKSENIRIEAHHYDYNKPLNIIWLCVTCHKNEDGKLSNLRKQ